MLAQLGIESVPQLVYEIYNSGIDLESTAVLDREYMHTVSTEYDYFGE